MSFNDDTKYTEEEMRQALRLFIDKEQRLHVPAQDSDADMVIGRSIRELIELRAWKAKARPFLEENKELYQDNLDKIHICNFYNDNAKNVLISHYNSNIKILTELIKGAE